MKSSKVINVTTEELHTIIAGLGCLSKSQQDPGLMAKLVMLAEENSNILSRADIIVNQRGEEKDRQYGNFHESMAKTAEVFNKLRRVQGYQDTLSPEDVYWVMVCLKLTREAVTHREDNLLDAVAYLGALNNHLEK